MVWSVGVATDWGGAKKTPPVLSLEDALLVMVASLPTMPPQRERANCDNHYEEAVALAQRLQNASLRVLPGTNPNRSNSFRKRRTNCFGLV